VNPAFPLACTVAEFSLHNLNGSSNTPGVFSLLDSNFWYIGSIGYHIVRFPPRESPGNVPFQMVLVAVASV
jgi:hypothetical protein